MSTAIPEAHGRAYRDLIKIRDQIVEMLEKFEEDHPGYTPMIMQDYSHVTEHEAHVGCVGMKAYHPNAETIGTGMRMFNGRKHA